MIYRVSWRPADSRFPREIVAGSRSAALRALADWLDEERDTYDEIPDRLVVAVGDDANELPEDFGAVIPVEEPGE
jgi:hypothetical protein